MLLADFALSRLFTEKIAINLNPRSTVEFVRNHAGKDDNYVIILTLRDISVLLTHTDALDLCSPARFQAADHWEVAHTGRICKIDGTEIITDGYSTGEKITHSLVVSVSSETLAVIKDFQTLKDQ